MRRAIAGFSAVFALAAGSFPARAGSGEPSPSGTSSSTSNEAPATHGAPTPPITPLPTPVPAKRSGVRRERVEWDPAWPRFRWWEYAGTAAVYAADIYVRYYMPPPDHAAWEGGNFFDDTIRNWLRSSTHSGRYDAVKVSDYVSWAGTAYPFAVDLPVVWFVHGQPGVMWQMLMMDLEANAVAGLLNNLLFHYAGRGRPNTSECSVDSSYDPLCGGIGDNASFPSGHTLTIATAAGLVCVHHRYLPIYGADWADDGACVLLGAATVTTGIARIVADRHFASDVIIGGAIGFAAGYGLPWLLHYRARKPGEAADAPRPAVAILPMASPDTLGLSVAGIGY